MTRIFTKADLDGLDKIRKEMEECGGPKTIEDIRKLYPGYRVEETETGYTVTQNRGCLNLDKNGKFMDGIYADES